MSVCIHYTSYGLFTNVIFTGCLVKLIVTTMCIDLGQLRHHHLKYDRKTVNYRQQGPYSQHLIFFAIYKWVLISQSMDKLQLTGQTLGRVFNFRSGWMHNMHLIPGVAIQPSLELKTRPKLLLGSLPLVIALPGLYYLCHIAQGGPSLP